MNIEINELKTIIYFIFMENLIIHYLQSFKNLNSDLIESVTKILSTSHHVSPWFNNKLNDLKFFKNNEEYQKNVNRNEFNQNIVKTIELLTIQFDYWQTDNASHDELNFNLRRPSTNKESLHNQIKKEKEEEESNQKNDKIFTLRNFETYKQLKKAAKKFNPNITKEEIYEKLLMPFNHEKVKTWDNDHTKFKITYICKYDGCNKEFDKTWNMLDHVRMHEGIRPYPCKICGSSFTQK